MVGFYPDARRAARRSSAVLGSGIVPAALEYLDGGALAAAGAAFPGGVPEGAGFLVIAEADGSRGEAERLQRELVEVLGRRARSASTRRASRPRSRRSGAGATASRFAVIARRGGKVSEDIVVPLDRARGGDRGDGRDRRAATACRRCSWGHAGDGNLHSTFLVDPRRRGRAERARGRAPRSCSSSPIRLGGSVSGEHGIGLRQARPARAAVGAARARPARADQARLRPEGPAQPGQEARPPGPAASGS